MVPEHLADPLRWRRPRRIFVNSMSDLFHEKLEDEQIAVVFGIMALAAQHTYQVLTKRAGRMRGWCARWTVDMCLDVLAHYALPSGERIGGGRPWNRPARKEWLDVENFPVPWIWMGVSVENRDVLDRVDDLRGVPAGVRFLSVEPMLEDLGGALDLDGIGWVIAGCESGLDARAAPVEGFVSLRDQCRGAGVPFFLKQAEACTRITCGPSSSQKARRPGGAPIIGLPELDGEQHRAFPEVA
jgi:protein gp37